MPDSHSCTPLFSWQGAVFWNWTRDGIDASQPAPVQVSRAARRLLLARSWLLVRRWLRVRRWLLVCSCLRAAGRQHALWVHQTCSWCRRTLSWLSCTRANTRPQLTTDADAFYALLESKGVGSDRPVVVRRWQIDCCEVE